ncbi:winged helix-turn-helix domain-containing protein [Natronosporangium hydrolyticum]|uniref:Winged helix-turn-helix domain-containing protein n=1 Tax=Natronosporangium hydrolyticum TaxID=2811111 RepID=A0A895YE93_9ACTN|nr:winged helix-turn-helix domain-containing protein [Natronosporangium hydrolyticum]QSB13719.1 winged helix-turn-helix domain-containing protein [Natronosporangium hydrolyticum]
MARPHRAPIRDESSAALAGYTVAIASDRRRHGVAALLESVGARTVGVQAARSVAKPDPAQLRAATERCLAAPCQEVVISTALGLRAWLTAARRWGVRDELVARFAGARLLARDAAAADGLRALGFREIFSTEGESTEELLRFLAAQSLHGQRVVVQTDRQSLTEATAVLAGRGAEVVDVPTYTATGPAETFSVRRLLDLVARRQVEALALVGGQAADQLRSQAVREGRLAELTEALREEVICVALGPDSAAPLATAQPALAAAPYPAELAEALLARLPSRALRVASARHQLELRGHAVVLDGSLIPVQAGPLAVLRALAQHPGEVLSAADIRAALPQPSDVDDHAVEMAISRLRQALRTAAPHPAADLVQTIVKHGYRLAL